MKKNGEKTDLGVSEAKAKQFVDLIADLIHATTYRATVAAIRDSEERRGRLSEADHARLTDLISGQDKNLDALCTVLVQNVNG